MHTIESKLQEKQELIEKLSMEVAHYNKQIRKNKNIVEKFHDDQNVIDMVEDTILQYSIIVEPIRERLANVKKEFKLLQDALEMKEELEISQRAHVI